MVSIRYNLKKLLSLIGEATVKGSLPPELEITGVAALNRATRGDLAFLGNLKYKHEVEHSQASVILVPKDYNLPPKEAQVFLQVDNPSLALGKICRDIERQLWPKPKPQIHPTAVVDASAKIALTAFVGPLCIIGENAVIGENVVLEGSAYIGREVQIGADSYLMPRVTILDYCQIGERVRLASGVVIGSDGYGYETQGGIHERIPQIGRVVLEDDVEIGANTTLDRARLHETRVGAGTKIDNLVQIAHNVTIGKNCLIVALVGIAGSTKLEDNVVIGGQSGLAGHLNIGKGSVIGGQSGVNHDIPPGSYVRGAPALPYMQAHRIDVLKKHVPELFKRVDTVEATLQRLLGDGHKE